MNHQNIVPAQLASPAAVLPTGRHWLFERKYDGYRLQLSAGRNGIVRAHTRKGIDWTTRLAPWIFSISGALPTGTVLDGELCVRRVDGQTSFSLLGEAIKQGQPLCFHAFDVLQHRGYSTIALPLADRKALLADILAEVASPPLQLVDFVVGEGESLLDQVRLAGHEGVVAKRLDAPYRPGQRSPDWLKFKVQSTEEFLAVGYHANSTQGLTSLILASLDLGGLKYRGRVGTGFGTDERWCILQRLGLSRSAERPATLPSLPGARWLSTPLPVQVRFTHIAPSGCLLHSVFQGIREDLAVSAVA